MSRRAAVLAAPALVAAALAPAGAAQTTNTYALLSPSQPVPAPPPLTAGANAPQTQSAVEFRLPIGGKVSMRELVVVGVGADGVPVRVAATQRLRLTGTGDYAFTIPAPATSAGPTEESQSAPGLRDVGIVWQGFSNKQRILSARATLRTAPAAAALPLKVHVESTGSTTVVRLENATTRKLPIVTSRTSLSALLGVLAKLRKASGPTQIGGGSVYVPGTAGHGASITTAAPLRVTGVLRQGSAETEVDAVLGHGRPLERSFTLSGSGAPQLQLRVALLAPIAVLPTPAELRAQPKPLDALQTAIGAVAISHAYRHYIAGPTPAAASDATYLYRSVRATAPAAPAAGSGGGNSTLAIVLGLLGGAAALCGLTVVWARS